MGNNTTVGVTAVAGALTAIGFWLLGFYQPELMASAPGGIEATVTAAAVAVIGWVKQ